MADSKIVFRVEIDDKGNIVKLKSTEKGISDVDLSAKRAANTASKLKKELSSIGGGKVPKSIKLTKGELEGLNTELKRSSDATGAYTSSALELGRVISDAPYGIRGMANNITQLVSQMAFATKSAGGFGNALRGLWSAMMGPLGVVLAVTTVVSIIDGLYGANKKAEESTDDLRSSFEKLSDIIRNNVNASVEEYVSLMSKKNLLDNDMVKSSERVAEIQERLAEIAESRSYWEKIKSGEIKSAGQTESVVKGILNQLTKEENELNQERVDLYRESAEKITDFNDKMDNYVRSVEGSINWYKEEISILEKQQKRLKIGSDRYKELSEAIRKVKKEFDDLTGKTKKLQEVQVGTEEWYAKAISDLEKIRKQTAKSTEEYKAQTTSIVYLREELAKLRGDAKKSKKDGGEEIVLKGSVKWYKELISARKSDREDFATTTEEYKKYTEEIEGYQKRLDALMDKRKPIKLPKVEKLVNLPDAEKVRKHYEDVFNALGDANTFEKALDQLNVAKASGHISEEFFDEMKSELEKKFASENIMNGVAPKLELGENAKNAIAEYNKKFFKELARDAAYQDFSEYAEVVQQGLGVVNDFIDGEFERRLTIEQNQTNALNEELNQRLLNENLSKDERAKIQQEIWQNDENLRKKQNEIKKKQFNSQKAFNIAEALINTSRAAAGVMADAQGGFFTRLSQAIPTIAFGLAQVAMIARQKFQPEAASTPIRTASGAGGAGGAGGGVGDRSFNFNLVGANQQNQILGAIQSQFDKPIKAYVVSKDITNQQQLDANTKSTARFGG